MKYNSWQEEMDALCLRTEKNWEHTGRRNIAMAVTGSLSLEKKVDTRKKDEVLRTKNEL
jgi:hypothetical protein